MSAAHPPAAAQSGRLYAAVWRWHFYAGLIVAPFFLIAALSGIVMTLKTPVEAVAYGDRLYVEPQETPVSPDAQLAAVEAAYPHADILTYIPPKAANRSAQFIVSSHAMDGGHGGGHGAGEGLSVYVDPYTGEVLGALDPAKTLYAYAKTMHGTLFLGAFGDHLIEIAAGFGVLMIVTGLFLWAPRKGQSFIRAATPQLEKPTRTGWRSLHGPVGFWIAPALLFFLLSGLAWTPVWGGKFVQAWSSFPAARFAAPVSEETHGSMNHDSRNAVPWALEQTPMPQSGANDQGAHGAAAPDLTFIVAMAREKGFTGFRVNLPKGEAGAWTVMAATISGDIANPLKDRTLHVDRHSGAVIADVGFAEYSPMGKAMAAGVPLHQGDLGAWNIALNVFFCLTVIAMVVSGLAMWWLRRPNKGFRLAPPPAEGRAWRKAAAAMFVVSMLFPLTAAALVAVVAADFFATGGWKARA